MKGRRKGSKYYLLYLGICLADRFTSVIHGRER